MNHSGRNLTFKSSLGILLRSKNVDMLNVGTVAVSKFVVLQ